MSSKILGKYPENAELIRERLKCSFSVIQLTNYIEGDPEKTQRRRELEKHFYEDTNLDWALTAEYSGSRVEPVDYLSADGVYEEALVKAARMYSKALSLEDPREVLAVGEAIHHEATPLLLHFIMFIPALMGHATEQQLERWLADAIELKVIGTYAQTELGHGTFVRGLQTRATYDPETEHFVLESPTLPSIKWWPGGLGKTANWAIVVAQVHSKGQCHGVHPFMVQIRDMVTHKPLPGVVVGEIGPKMGLKAADNGFLQLNQVRIPRDHMLMKNAQVDREGNFSRAQSDKLNYGTMVFVRVILIDMVAFNVGRAVTIATRYSAVRRQAEIVKGSGEVQILDYKAQQAKLFTALAASHAFKAAYVFLMTAYKEVSDDIEDRGDTERIGQLHAVSSGLKALCSELGSAAIERCRLACGGHGYLLISGLPRLYATTVAACTYEGENTVLYLQTARHLLKQMSLNGQSRSCGPEIEYLFDGSYHVLSVPVVWQFIEHDQLDGIVSLYQAAALSKLKAAHAKLAEETRTLNSSELAWAECQVELIAAAKGHLIYFLMLKYCHWVANAPDALRPVVSPPLSTLHAMADKVKRLLADIRPDAVSLVDAFDYHDVVLMSALGCHDGAVYERLFEMAKRSPLNKSDPHPAFIKHIKSLTNSKL
ncbi:Peroxisomal acyl-coenzyme A oxidase 1 [Halotydeus destructor]|nr:Peroxisomal acyl-coenzyme A oxidase 1 [Halotydeus destructor]